MDKEEIRFVASFVTLRLYLLSFISLVEEWLKVEEIKIASSLLVFSCSYLLQWLLPAENGDSFSFVEFIMSIQWYFCQRQAVLYHTVALTLCSQ